MYNMHNAVNKQLGKPEYSWRDFIYFTARLSQLGAFSFEEVLESAGDRSYLDAQSLLYLVAGIGIGAVAFAAYKHYIK